MVCHNVDFLGFIPFGVRSASWEIFRHDFFEYFFSPALSLLSFQDSSDTVVGSLVIVSHVPESLLILIFIVFSMLCKLGNFYCSLIVSCISSILLEPLC